MQWLLPGLLLPSVLRLLSGLLLLTSLCRGEVAPAAVQLLPSSSSSSAISGHDDAPVVSLGSTGSPGGEAARSGNASSNVAGVPSRPERNQPMTQRALSVLVLASAALIVYFVIRTVRLRRRSRKTRRYGVLDTNIENTELTPLEQDDDDDDTTLFDANHPRSYDGTHSTWYERTMKLAWILTATAYCVLR
ncbi:membrane protein FAM174A isoform X2 [Rhineura floridana]|uniref:membrane protein FAM174A isoform X2 n=1 Tax=Rhineura floridana TaxID=261503 RepID=UPI002AC7F013|nr:membrane protein FAM174A isoform X2 [Rhineura floridana]